MFVWHERSPEEAAAEDVPPAKSFEFSVVPHQLASGEPIESLQRQRKQYNVKLFILRHLKSLFGMYTPFTPSSLLFLSICAPHAVATDVHPSVLPVWLVGWFLLLSTEQSKGKWAELAMPKLGLCPPTEWWTADDDRNLLLGVYRHGWGKFKDLRDDPELGFSPAALRLRLKQKRLDKHKKKAEGEEEVGKKEEDDVTNPDFPLAATLNKRLMRLVEELATTAKPSSGKSPLKKKKKMTKKEEEEAKKAEAKKKKKAAKGGKGSSAKDSKSGKGGTKRSRADEEDEEKPKSKKKDKKEEKPAKKQKTAHKPSSKDSKKAKKSEPSTNGTSSNGTNGKAKEKATTKKHKG
jgi:hypothetical protein